ncbi:hypothetical protein [Streptomyces sp. XH2]|uniref:hypothetical protein n=1 Tax=Streptomyces sp. XH2 TaxID=3412483 RepID=UPI003C7A6E07
MVAAPAVVFLTPSVEFFPVADTPSPATAAAKALDQEHRHEEEGTGGEGRQEEVEDEGQDELAAIESGDREGRYDDGLPGDRQALEADQEKCPTGNRSPPWPS